MNIHNFTVQSIAGLHPSSTLVPPPISLKANTKILTKDGCIVFHTRFLIQKSERGSDFDNTVKTIRFEMGGVHHNRSPVIFFNFMKNHPSILINWF